MRLFRRLEPALERLEVFALRFEAPRLRFSVPSFLAPSFSAPSFSEDRLRAETFDRRVFLVRGLAGASSEAASLVAPTSEASPLLERALLERFVRFFLVAVLVPLRSPEALAFPFLLS